jgi:hypothetical protein
MPEEFNTERPAGHAAGPAAARPEGPRAETNSEPRGQLEGYSLETLSALLDA